MAGTGQEKDNEFEDSAEEDLRINLSMHLLSPEKLDERHRDHCDYLLDAIDEQLDQLQSRSSFKTFLKSTSDLKDTSTTDPEQMHDARSLAISEAITSKTDESMKNTGSKKDEYKWRLAQLLGLEQADSQDYHSDSNSAESVCTEDFAVKFKQEMVESIACGGDEDEDHNNGKHQEDLGLSLPLFDGNEDPFTLNTARRENILQQFKEQLKDDLQAALKLGSEEAVLPDHRRRRASVESLGGQISRLSQVHTSEPSSTCTLERRSSIDGLLSSNGNYRATREDNAVDDGFEKYPENQSYVSIFSPCDTTDTVKETVTSNFYNGKAKCTKTGNIKETNITDVASRTGTSAGGWTIGSEDTRDSSTNGVARTKYGNPVTDFSSELQLKDINKNEVLESSITCEEPVNTEREVSTTREESKSPHKQLETCGTFSLRLNEVHDCDSSLKEDNTNPALYKHVAGVPLRSFESVTVDSDLDSVTTERVRDHIRKALSSSKRDFSHSGNRRGHNSRDDGRLYTGSGKVSTDEDKEMEWRSGSPKRWSSSPIKTSDSSRDRSAKAATSEFLYSPEQVQNRRIVEKLATDREILEEAVAKLHKEVAFEEERLSQRKAQYREADQHVTDVLQQKKDAYQELESLRDLLEQTQKEVAKMETRLRESQMTEEDFRRELVILEYKRGEYIKEVQELELELESIRQQCSSTHSNQVANFQFEISSLTTERDELRTRIRHLEGSLSFMERQELERQLSSTKSELFSEQRTARAKIEKLQENLEELQYKLEEKVGQCAEKQEQNKQLKSQLCELEKKYEAQFQTQEEQATKMREESNQQIADLGSQVREQVTRIASLEKILSEKELDLLKLRDAISSMKAEKETQVLATEALKEEHSKRLAELQFQHYQDREEHVAKLKEEMQCQKQKEIQQFAENMEQLKAKALQDQAETLKNEMEKVINSQEMKDKEIAKLKEALKSQKEMMKKLAVELKQEARELVHNTLLREQKKWENEKRDALQIQRHTLEEEKLRELADIREALERERRACMVLEKKSMDLQNIIQEHEIHQRVLHREKQEALDELRAVLNREKQEEMRRLEEALTHEKERNMDRLKQRLQEMEDEQHVLRAEKNESIFREREALAQAERAERALAREISAACERILNTPGRPKIQSPSRSRHGSPTRLSPNQALQMLHGISEETNQWIHDLQQEIEAQKRTVLHVQKEKERELQQLKDQLHLEREKALEELRERLIQEHIEEITNLQRDQLRESGGAENQSLRQQLREKDNELRAIQRNMAKWKDETATKLAQKFEEELNAELEKCKMEFLRERSLLRSKASDSHRTPERVGSAIRRLSLERKENSHLRSISTPSLNGAAAQHDLSALKILRNLQGRVRELRADNRPYHGGSMDDLTMLRTDLGSSYREKRPVIMERSMSQIQGGTRK
ncbi:uncharacterized protein PAF06_004562 [Gastrophryne carolinensis]